MCPTSHTIFGSVTPPDNLSLPLSIQRTLKRSIGLRMPLELIYERYFVPQSRKTIFVQHASLFQDIVIRCVRYAFARIPARIGAVFFSKPVSLPFIRFRMFRHGYLNYPIQFKEVIRPGLRGVQIIGNLQSEPDVVVLYCHGGGFSMGSTYFYLEFLMAWASLLKSRGHFQNPAIFAVEYTLVPKATFPTQLDEVLEGYRYATNMVKDRYPGRVCIAGDSAGATLTLTLLLKIAADGTEANRPAFATLISPWCVLIDEMNRNTPSDYLDVESLRLYARQYIGTTVSDDFPSLDRMEHKPSSTKDWLASPGLCKDLEIWKRASPKRGYHFVYGSEEVFARSARELVKLIRSAGVAVEVSESLGAIHAWPVVSLFLKDSIEDRLAGLHEMVDTMQLRMLDCT